MRERLRLRLRFVLPLAAVAAVGLGVIRLDLLERVGLVPEDGAPVAASSAGAVQGTADAEPAPTETPVEQSTPLDTGSAEAEQPPAESGGIEKLDTALAENKVVVLVVYTPGATLDELITREARLGAADVNAGFVTVNGAKEKMVGELALTYDLRDTPAVLVFRRGPELRTMLAGYADRETVAQAAQDARRKA